MEQMDFLHWQIAMRLIPQIFTVRSL